MVAYSIGAVDAESVILPVIFPLAVSWAFTNRQVQVKKIIVIIFCKSFYFKDACKYIFKFCVKTDFLMTGMITVMNSWDAILFFVN